MRLANVARPEEYESAARRVTTAMTFSSYETTGSDHAHRDLESVHPCLQCRCGCDDPGDRLSGAPGRGPAVGPRARSGDLLHRPRCRARAGAWHRDRGLGTGDAIQGQPQGLLGFHTEDQGGKLWGVVAAKPELDNCGNTAPGD